VRSGASLLTQAGLAITDILGDGSAVLLEVRLVMDTLATEDDCEVGRTGCTACTILAVGIQLVVVGN
jgi:hypothetical protein